MTVAKAYRLLHAILVMAADDKVIGRNSCRIKGAGEDALRRSDLNLDDCVVRVVRSTAQMNDGGLIAQEPESRAGRRTNEFPRDIADELRRHVERLAEPGDDGLMFAGPPGGRLPRLKFRDLWLVALADAGISGLRLHDLRHTGNMMAAATGASLRELMERMGH